MTTLQIRFPTATAGGYRLTNDPSPRVDRAPLVSAGAVVPCFYNVLTVPYEQLTETTARVTIEKFWDFLPIKQAVGDRWLHQSGAPEGFIQIIDANGTAQTFTGEQRAAVWGATQTGLAPFDLSNVATFSRGYLPTRYRVREINPEFSTLALECITTQLGAYITTTATATPAETVKQNDLLFDVTPPRIVYNCHVEQISGGGFHPQFLEFNIGLYVGAQIRINPGTAQQFTPYDFTFEI